MDYKKMYEERLKTVEGALDLIESRDYIFSAQAAGESEAILSRMEYLGETGVRDVVLNTCLPLKDYPVFKNKDMKGIISHNGWFFSQSLREAHRSKLVSAIPQSSTTILSKTLDRVDYEARRPVLIATVSPMDRHGYLSLSVSSIYERDLVNRGAFVIVEVNPNYPRTFGDSKIHISEIDALVESKRPIPSLEITDYTEVDEKIAGYIADLVEDGSTLQLGIGNIPNAVAGKLKDKRDLGIHTEMFTESMLDLIEAGAVNNSKKGLLNGYSVCSFAMGSSRLYDYLDDNPSVLFKSSTFTNDPYTIGRNNKFISINSALEIDLMGQCAAETLNGTQYSGTGGHSETVNGAQRSKGGKSIVAMHSCYLEKDSRGNLKRKSKLVPSLSKNAVVTTSRNDMDYVVTEYGVAWLRGLNIEERVEALINIAHPDFRGYLRLEAEKNKIW